MGEKENERGKGLNTRPAADGMCVEITLLQSKLQLADDAHVLDDKAKSSLKHGLFSYPILQAADILVHRATHVPVGEDQRQHLEFARECVTNFNHAYKGKVLVAPETILCKYIVMSSQPVALPLRIPRVSSDCFDN